MNSIMEERSVLKERLLKVQTAIDKATQDAWKQTATTTSPRSVAPSVDNSSSNASFLLGMDLFGQDVSIVERAVQDKLEDLEDELRTLLQSSNENNQSMSLDTSIMTTAEDEEDLNPEALQQQVDGYRDKISFLKQASLARSVLDESISLSSAALTPEPNLVQASQHVVQALKHVQQAQAILEQSNKSKSISSQEQLQVAAHPILDSLQTSIRRHRVELVHKACGVLDTSLQIHSSHSLSAKTSTQLDQAYQVLETLEGGHSALEDSMRRLTSKLYTHVLEPLLVETRPHLSPWKLMESTDQPTKSLLVGVSTNSSKKGTVHRIQWHRSDEETDVRLESPIEVWKDTLTVLTSILSFVQSKILLERPALCRLVGTKLFGKPDALPSNLKLHALGLESALLGDDQGLLMERLVDEIAKSCLPDRLEPSELHTLATTGKELLNASIPFCKEMVDRQVLAKDPPPKLISFARAFAQNYVNHRRCVLLDQARSILTQDYHNTVPIGVEVVPDDAMAIFQLHKSSISQTAMDLMKLIRTTMDEAVAVPPVSEEDSALSVLRPTLYRTAREMLSLFRAIIPASHGKEVAHVPRTAAVLHNDCVYLAHHCLTLGLEYQQEFDDQEARGKLLQQTCIFVDLVPLFRELADQAMGDMLDLQKHQLADLVGSRIGYLGQALSSDESVQEWSDAETALAAGSYHLRHLSQAWKPPLLSQLVYSQSMEHLAAVIFSLYLDPILTKSSTISPNAAQFLHVILSNAMDELGRLIILGDEDRGSHPSSDDWQRVRAVTQCLDMPSLKEIEAALTQGVFRQVASHELAHLIQARFPATEERRRLLSSLANV